MLVFLGLSTKPTESRTCTRLGLGCLSSLVRMKGIRSMYWKRRPAAIAPEGQTWRAGFAMSLTQNSTDVKESSKVFGSSAVLSIGALG